MGLPAVPEAVAVAVHLQDVDVVGEAVQQRSVQPLRAEDLGPFVEGQGGGHHDGVPIVALAEDLEEQVRSGEGQGHVAQFVDDQQAEAGQIPLQVEQRYLIPGFQRSALPRFHRRDAPSEVPQPVYFAAMALLDHRACRMVAESGGLARASPSFAPPMAGNSPVYGPGWKFPLVVAQGMAGKPGCTTLGRNPYFRYSSTPRSRQLPV